MLRGKTAAVLPAAACCWLAALKAGCREVAQVAGRRCRRVPLSLARWVEVAGRYVA